MNLRMMFLLVFLNHCYAEEYFKNYFIIITDIKMDVLKRGVWSSPIITNEDKYSNVCEAFRNLPIFQINSTFPDSDFNNWTNDYRILFRKRKNRSKMVHTYRRNLFVNNDLTIKYAFLCSWENSIVYITRNSKITMGFVLFIRNENTGLKLLGVTARFVPLSMNRTHSDVSEMIKELFSSRGKRVTLRSAWLYSNQRLVWEVCATIYWLLTPESHAEKSTKLECSLVYEDVNLHSYRLGWGESPQFPVLKIESNYKKYDVLSKLPTYLYVNERESGMLSLCELPMSVIDIIYKMTNCTDIEDNVYEYVRDE